MKVLIDTNILVDVIARREPFWKSSNEILELCRKNTLSGFVSTRAFCDLFYVLRKSLSVKERKDTIKWIRGYLDTVIITNQIVDDALENDAISDFEDAIQYACAESVDADYIVTRNIKDYGKAEIRAISPEELLKLMS